MNPILQSLRGQNNLLQTVMAMRGNPQAAFNMLMEREPRFRQFYEENKNKTPEQIMREYGIDPAAVQRLMK